jgi:hypothetical protein
VVAGKSLMMVRMVDKQRSLMMMMGMVDKQRSFKIKMMITIHDDDFVNNPYTAEAQFPKTRPLTFRNFMDYCQELQVVLQQHRAIFSSKRQDILAHDATFKKHGRNTSGGPREKRLIGNTEKAKMIMEDSRGIMFVL